MEENVQNSIKATQNEQQPLLLPVRSTGTLYLLDAPDSLLSPSVTLSYNVMEKNRWTSPVL